MTLELEDRLWEQLEAAADREAARGQVARIAAATRRLLPAWRLRAVAVTVAAAVAAVALVVALTLERAQSQWRVTRFGSTGAHLSAGVSADGAFWSYDRRSGAVLRLDPRTHRVLARVALPPTSTDVSLVSGADAVWAIPSAAIQHSSPAPVDPAPVTLVRIDPRTDRATASVVLRAPDGSTLRPVDIVALPDAIWVWGEGGAMRVDPRTNGVTRMIRPRGERVMGFAATDARVSFFTDLGELVTFDARTGERLGVVPLDAPVGAQNLIAIGDDIVTYRQGGTLASIDPLTGRDRWAVHLGSRPRDLTLAGGRLWLLMAEPGAGADELRALDPGDGHVVARVALPTGDGAVIAPDGQVPIVTTQSGALVAVRPPP